MRVIESIEKLADDILSKAKIRAPKVDPFRVAESMGLVVIADQEMDDDISGLLSMNKGVNVILCNKLHGENRQRFTVAHEIGHFVLHRHRKDTFVDSKILYRKESNGSGNWKQEMEANAFAAALLMPRLMVEKKLRNKNIDLVEDDNLIISDLAKEFGVSQIAMTFRINNLGLL